MPRRQQLLLTAVIVMLVAYVGDMAYRNLYETPLVQQQRREETLRDKLHETRLQIRREQKKTSRLDKLRQQSLPRDLELAVTTYRSWMLEQIQRTELEQTSIDSGQPVSLGQGALYRIDFSLRSQGSLENITALLQRFYAASFLHRIRSISLNPSGPDRLDLSMTIEVLVLPNGPKTMQPVQYDDTLLSHQAYQQIPRRNLFRQSQSRLSDLELTAITVDANGQREAWIVDRADGRTTRLRVGEQHHIGPWQLEIEAISERNVTLRINGQSHELMIGRAFAEQREQP